MVPESLNIAELFLDRRLAEGQGERIALRLPEGDMTYQQVHALAQDYARALRHRGVRREERVLIALADGADFVGALFGVLKLGAVVVMLNPRLKVEEIAAQMEYTRARMLIVGGEVEPSFRSAAENSPWLESGFLVAGREVANDHADGLVAALSEADPDELQTASTHRDDPAIWLYSGGTTGRPKAVVQSHRSFAVTTELYAQKTLGYGADDITLSVPKLFFGYFFPFRWAGRRSFFPSIPPPRCCSRRSKPIDRRF